MDTFEFENLVKEYYILKRKRDVIDSSLKDKRKEIIKHMDSVNKVRLKIPEYSVELKRYDKPVYDNGKIYLMVNEGRFDIDEIRKKISIEVLAVYSKKDMELQGNKFVFK